MTNFTIRHYNPDSDLSSLSLMLTEIESIDRDGEETSEEFLRSMTEWPNFNPAENVWVSELDGKLVGYGQVLPRTETPSTIYVVVHPNQRRQGLGNQLLALVLSRADAKSHSRKILVYANGHNAASLAFLHHHGFKVAGTSGVMSAPVTDLPQAEIPAGFSLRRYPELGDPQILVQALNECYKDQVGHHQNVTSADRYADYYGEEGIHLLFDDHEKLLGICAAKPAGKTDQRGVSDLLDAPGLIKEFRHNGHQRFLALAVMNWLRGHGTRTITLEYWGDDEKAIEIYRGLGFELTNEQLTYHKELA
ncbi:MAG: GNAT family N-acetyltransferase [Anaerolineaceae bacterium]|nr:MAG: GNAT family N-acetyltransferase [Anaerolineaceae bacterium]